MTNQGPFFFLHIPKTAGTSFRLGFEQYYGKQRIAYDYGAKADETHPDLKGVSDERDRKELLHRILANGSVDVIAGHVPWRQYQDIFSQRQVVVFFREPVQRVLSEYNHYVNHFGYKESITRFYQSNVFRNKQYYYAKGLDLEQLKFFGITEYYGESLRFFNDMMGVEIPSLRVNTGREGVRGDHDVSQELAEDIRRYNALDVEIYHAAVSLFCSRYGIPKPSALHAPNLADKEPGEEKNELLVGRVGGINEQGELFGWVVDQASDEPLWIDISINEVKVDTVQTGNYRSDLAEAGISKSGKAGFAYRLGEVSEGDTISVRVSGTTFELNNSPLLVK